MITDLIFKIKTLLYMLSDTYSNWEKEVWNKDLEENYCCDGTMCACGGDTIRDIYNSGNK